MKEYIVPIDETALDYEETFIGFIRKQEELIRCKDCKWYFYIDEEDHECSLRDCYGWDYTPDSYCSWAERGKRK